MTLYDDGGVDPYAPAKQLGAARRPWRPVLLVGAGIAVVAAAIAADVKIVAPWWPFRRDEERAPSRDLMAAFPVPAGDWEPTPPPAPEPVVLETTREVRIPAMIAAAPTVPLPAAPPPPAPVPGVTPHQVSLDGPISYVADNSSRPPLDMLDGRISAQAQGCALRPGMVIHAALLDAVRWDMGGEVVGQVTRAVLSPERPQNELIPQGALLIGTADVAPLERGRDLAPAPVWRLVRWRDPDTGEERARNLMGATGANVAGVNGIGGEVDQRWGPVLGLMALTTVFDVLGSVSISVGDSDTIDARISGGGAARIGERVGERLLDIEPTIYTPGGTQFLVKINTSIRMC
jgi:hypothetical protein